MTDRNRKLVPDSWSLVRETALTIGLCSEGWYSEHSQKSGAARKECKCEVLKGSCGIYEK